MCGLARLNGMGYGSGVFCTKTNNRKCEYVPSFVLSILFGTLNFVNCLVPDVLLKD